MIRPGAYRAEHQRFSRQWWATGVRNFFWVALVTILIWIYADMKFTDSKTLVVTVRLKATNMVLLSPEDRRVSFTAEGSRDSLERFEREMKDVVVFDVSGYGPGRNINIPTRDILNKDPAIVKAGLRVTGANPSVISVTLDEQVHQTVPVELVVSGADLIEPPQQTMGITVAKSRWQEILDHQSNPVLKTKEKDLKNRQPGQQAPVTFEIIPTIADIPVKPDQDSITIPVEIGQRTDKKKMTVAVRVEMLPDWDDMRKYDLVRKDPLEWRPEITVTGPRADLDKLDPKDVDAYVVLREDDKRFMETFTTRPVQIRFPPGLQVQLDGPPPQVSFRLDKRSDNAANP